MKTRRGRFRYALRCGGSLVTQTRILTAAHCLFDEGLGRKLEDTQDLLVVLGSSNPLLTAEGIERTIAAFSHHPDYIYPQSYMDIAIATLNETIPPEAFRNIRPICLPTKPSQNPGNCFCPQCSLIIVFIITNNL